MSAPPVEKIANAVLYEGYLLYPYRSSAVKNRQVSHGLATWKAALERILQECEEAVKQ